MHLWWGGGVEEQMHNVDYDPLDPSWRQTLRLPLPGIEPGSPASQAGTLPKELSYQDSLYQCCGSGIFIQDPGS